MKIEVDVNSILPTEIDSVIYLLKNFLIDVGPVVLPTPGPVRQRQSREVEPPFRHRGEIEFIKRMASVWFFRGSEPSLQIEASPPGNSSRVNVVDAASRDR